MPPRLVEGGAARPVAPCRASNRCGAAPRPNATAGLCASTGHAVLWGTRCRYAGPCVGGAAYSGVFTVDLGRLLRGARRDAGVSLGAMAARTHFSKGHLGNVESGRRVATPEVVAAYEQALGVKIQSRVAELTRLLDGVSDVPRPSTAGMGDVVAVEAATNMLTALELDRGGGLACEMGKGQLRWAIGLLGANMNDSVRERLSAVVATLANRTGFSLFDAGDPGSAAKLSRLALNASESAGDTDLTAHILTDMASQLVHLGDPAGALRVIDIPDRGLSAVTRFTLHGMRAQAHGSLGDASETWRHAAS
ncbi:helix-turn-helix transcriptional regulator [Micromonospora sp. WMMD1082]|uniref:helix-turn-helix domain-containing protein n=1 Tax=Micromonospora sp. WMMD1082 TaxID=3016104 RepID=UPI0024164CFD|nr:helix-turn-helix transcriptional regulator [Micromonospora sp. WMMD1082]MDG4792602.1 helix-turn-helix transcriptional regulator [Micromonospora sp. WMMD1082]